MGNRSGVSESCYKEIVNQAIQSLAVISNRMLERTIRMEGFLGMMSENCKACSSFPEHYPELKRELDAVIKTVEQLIEVLTKEDV